MKSANLMRLEELILSHPKADEVIYEGGAHGTGLYEGEDAVVQRAYLPAGAKFESHSHSSTEIIIVLSGAFHSSTAFLTCVTPVAGVVVFQPGVVHSHFAETACWVVSVLVPRDEGYPNAN